MQEKRGRNIVRLAPAPDDIRDGFLGWQCRIRQLSVRRAGGRPSSGMCPEVALSPEDPALGRIVVLVVKKDPEEITAEFRHMYKRTHDPADRYDAALRYLAAGYYQRPAGFSEEMTALFGADSTLAERLVRARRCLLDFEQYTQRYRLPCRVRDIPDTDPAFDATYWHNSLFNPAIPGGIRILGFRPDWTLADSDPPPGRRGGRDST